MLKFQQLPWPPIYDSRSQRLRGFYLTLVNRLPLADGLNVELRGFRHSEATRTSIRAVIDRKLLREFEGMIEAAIPIDHIFDGCSIVYLALNDARRPRDPSLPDQIERLARLKETTRVDVASNLEAQLRGYHLLRHKTLDSQIVEQLAALFAERFTNYPIETSVNRIRLMPEDHIVVTAHNSALAAVFMADCTTIKINGKQIFLFEFNNVVASNGVPHRILIPLMAYEVISEAAIYRDSVIFAEARADMLALQAACLAVGMQHCGTMVSSFAIEDKGRKDQIPYKSAHVWYLS